MDFKETQRKNTVTIIGKINSIDVKDGVSEKTGIPYIFGTIGVAANDSEYTVNFFENKTWKSGKENPKYNTIPALLNGEMVSLSCNLEGNKFLGNDGKIVTTNRLNLSFVNKPRQTDQEGLTFDITGVILSPLKEVRDKEDNIVNYTLTLGQAQYVGERGWSAIQLSVDPKNTAAINYIQSNFGLGLTVRPTGHGKATIKTREVRTEAAFGEDKVDIYQDHVSNYFIDSALIVAESDIYTNEQITYLNSATEEFNKTLASAKPAANPSGATQEKPKSAGALFGLNNI